MQPPGSNPYGTSPYPQQNQTYGGPGAPYGVTLLEREVQGLLGTVPQARVMNYDRSQFEVLIPGRQAPLYITLPRAFPSEPPQLMVGQPIPHPWVDASGRVLSDRLRRWSLGESSWSPLEVVVREVLDALAVHTPHHQSHQSNPPTPPPSSTTSSTISTTSHQTPPLPSPPPPPPQQHPGAHPQGGNPAFPTPPQGHSLFSPPSTPAPSHRPGLQPGAPQDPPTTVPSQTQIVDLTQDQSPPSDSTLQYPELAGLSNEELSELLSSDQVFEDLLAKIQRRQVSNDSSTLAKIRERNAEMAAANKCLFQQCRELANQVNIIRVTDFNPTKANFEEKAAKQTTVLSQLAPEVLYKKLSDATKVADEESEGLVRCLMENNIELSAFLGSYSQMRKTHHIREQKRLDMYAKFIAR